MSQRHPDTHLAQTDLRPADEVMRLERMGAFFPTRLSFMRSLIRRLALEKVTVTRPVWEISDTGFGRAVYSLEFGGHVYSLIAYSTELDPSQRTDRVIAEAWDASFVLFDGTPSTADLDRIEQNAPKQEAGRFTASELILSRANKSVRFFESTVEALSKGEQPDLKMVQEIGYLMRTTAVYGNGKFGISDRAKIQHRKHMSGPFQAEMLTVWLIRTFSHDLVEHVAAKRSPETAVTLSREIKRHLGIGNSTGLGMAPFLVNHPILLNNWMMVRETALARVRACTQIDKESIENLINRATEHLEQWNVPDNNQTGKIHELRQNWKDLHKDPTWMHQKAPWEALFERSKSFGLECQELTVAMMIEANGSLVDGLEDCMGSDITPGLDASVSTQETLDLIKNMAGWALTPNYEDRAESAQFWYVSEEKLEPRLGDRFDEPGEELETPLDIARQIKNFWTDLKEAPAQCIGEFLMRFPQHRNAARRIQALKQFPYGEIRDNLISDRCLPIDMLRCKLSFFGASKFDPKSDRWTRITLYQGAPLAADLAQISEREADDWWLPCFTP